MKYDVDSNGSGDAAGRGVAQRRVEPTTYVPVTLITSIKPRTLTKRVSLEGGTLKKQAGGQLSKGHAEIVEVEGLRGFANELQSLKSDNALAYGLATNAPIELTTKSLWLRDGSPEERMPRTNENFGWDAGPGIMMFDYDPEEGAPTSTAEALVATLRQAVPGLCDVEFLWWPSASSHIINTETGVDLTGLRGQRLYMIVKDARDIPRAGKALIDALWLAGHGYIKISKSGSMMLRTLVDATVWQTNRFDFAAGSDCEPPLVQDRGKPIIIPGTVDIVDTRTAIPDLADADVTEVKAKRLQARAARKSEADSIHAAWAAARANEVAGPDADQATIDAVRETLRSAVETSVLTGTFPITVIEDGVELTITVAEILDDPKRFDGMLTLDPIEPDHDDRRIVGKLYLLGRTACLHSQAHGGNTYRLVRQQEAIELKRGKLIDAVEATLGVLRAAPDVFDLGDALVVVNDGRLRLMVEAALGLELARRIQFWSWKRTPKGVDYKALEDPPEKLLKAILGERRDRKLKPLVAVITAPTLRLDGSVLDEPGYDVATRLYLDLPGRPELDIKMTPTDREVDDALDVLLKPFEKFPFVDKNDRGVLLAALLTAIMRPVLPKRPAFGFDAPAQGSGKTLLAESLGWMATGAHPSVYAHTGGGNGNDDEVRKRAFAALLAGQGAIVWDNVVGTFDSAAMAAVITSEEYSDRVLGKSETSSVPNRALFIFTGNNLTLAGDLSRRVLRCRIDPLVEQPYAREFDLDPSAHVRENRLEMVAAGITVMRGYLSIANAIERPGAGRMASFETWDDVVRQTVAWVDPTEFGDPMSVVVVAQRNDPERELLGSLLEAWTAVFGEEWTTVANVLQTIAGAQQLRVPGASNHAACAALAEALKEISENATRSASSLGKILKYRLGRIDGGRRIETRNGERGERGIKLWRVCAPVARRV